MGAGSCRRDVRRHASASAVRDRALRGRGVADGRRAQPAVRAAVSAVERRRRQAPLGAAARRRHHRRDATSIAGTSPSARASGRSSSSTGAAWRRGSCGRPARTSGSLRPTRGPTTRRDADARAGRRPRGDVAEVAPGKWHSIPSREECRACHDSGRTEVLGFTALQLSNDRDPLAPHAEPLDGRHGHAAHARRGAAAEPGARRSWPPRRRASPPPTRANGPCSATCRPTAAAATTGRARSPRWACS